MAHSCRPRSDFDEASRENNRDRRLVSDNHDANIPANAQVSRSLRENRERQGLPAGGFEPAVPSVAP